MEVAKYSVISVLEDILTKEQKLLDEMEYSSAPSGEFEEYNHHTLVQEAVVDHTEYIIATLKEQFKGN